MLLPRLLLLVLWFAAQPVWAAEPQPRDIDRIFAAWDKPDSPGLALAVVREGRVVYSRGYGQANLEHGIAITPATVFHVASVSKQFTAFAIHLLAQDGKLSLDDDVRRHLPELRVASHAPITIRHLLHHTSGLRDQWNLALLAGLRLDDSIGEPEVMSLIFQQRQLNFEPGEEELYSNTGYTLLAMIVRRASGKTLAAFARERIFEPLGMARTHFHAHYGSIVKNRASSYTRTGEGWRYTALSFSNLAGPTNLFTTADDLALWARNLETAEVGGRAVVDAMLARGRVAGGREIDYASGLQHGRHRGLPLVEHGGVDAGYRALVLRFPEQRLTVLLLGNAGNLDTASLGRRVADLYLDDMPGVTAARVLPTEVDVAPDMLLAYVGEYELRPGLVLNFTVQGNRLRVQATGRPQFELFASGNASFFAKAFDGAVSFRTAPGEGVSATWHQGGRDFPLQRVVRDAPAPEAMRACTGTFYSEELRTLYTVAMRGEQLRVRTPRFDVDLRPTTADEFTAGFPLVKVRFQRSAHGECSGFTVTTGRVRNLQFQRLGAAPAS